MVFYQFPCIILQQSSFINEFRLSKKITFLHQSHPFTFNEKCAIILRLKKYFTENLNWRKKVIIIKTAAIYRVGNHLRTPKRTIGRCALTEGGIACVSRRAKAMKLQTSKCHDCPNKKFQRKGITHDVRITEQEGETERLHSQARKS